MANEACNYISGRVWETKVFARFKLQRLIYHELRSKFSLGSQTIIRCIAKVCDAYAVNRSKQAVFKSTGSIPYDLRNLLIRTEKQYITIWTILGRIKINYTSGPKQLELLEFHQGESDLILRNKTWYLYCTVDIPEEDIQEISGILGVDLGIKNIAVTSDNKWYSGAQLNKLRHRHRKLRAKLQSKGTHSAKRLLRKRSKKERRFAVNVNHIISKAIVAEAKCTKRGISLENLKEITKRTKVRRRQRATQHGWGFYQLKTFIQYKAKRVGVQVFLINPARTSTTCPICGHYNRYNRKDRDHFHCKSCGYADHADYVAALNIASKAAAAVNQPNASVAPLLEASRRLKLKQLA